MPIFIKEYPLDEKLRDDLYVILANSRLIFDASDINESISRINDLFSTK